MRNKKAKKEPVKGVDEQVMKITDSKIIKSGEDIKKDEIKDIKESKEDNINLIMSSNVFETQAKIEKNDNIYIINKENINDNVNRNENPINDFNKKNINIIEDKNKENVENVENIENIEKKKLMKKVRIR